MGKRIVYTDGSVVNKYRPPEKQMWWRYLLMFLTGFFSAGIISAIVIAIMASSYSSKEIISLFGGDVSKFLQTPYQNMSVLELATTLSAQKFETLGDIYKITPVVKSILDDTVNPILDKELHYTFPWEEISKKPFSLPVDARSDGSIDTEQNLSTYIGVAIKEGVYIKNFISGDDIPSIVNLFLYPKNEDGNYVYDDPYSLMDYISADGEFYNNIVNSIKIKDLVGEYEDNKILDAIADWGINDFKNGRMETLSLGIFLPDNTDDPLTKAISPWTIGMLKEQGTALFKGLYISDVVPVDENTPKMLVSLINKKYTIGMLETNLYDILTVEDCFDISDSALLEALKGYYLSQLQHQSTYMGLTLGEVLPSSTSGSILDKFKDKTLNELSSLDINSVLITDIFSEDDIKGNKILKALTATYPKLTIGDLSNASVIQSLTLQDIMTDEQIASNKMVDALKTYSISEIPSKVNTIQIKDLIDIKSDASVLMKSIGEETIDTLPNFVNNLTIGQVMDLSKYDDNINNDEVKNTKVTNFDSLMETFKEHLKLKDVVTITDSSQPLLKKLQNCVLSNLENEIPNLVLGDFVTITDSSPKILVQLKTTKLSELSTKINSLTLEDVVNITTSSPKILQSLKDVNVLNGDALATKINSLELCDIYTANDCKEGVFKYIWDDTSGGHITFTQIPGAVNNLKLVNFLEDKIYVEGQDKEIDGKTYKRIDAIWWLFFTEKGETFTETNKYYILKNGLNYTIGNDLTKVVANFQNHVQNDSVKSLCECGLISIDSSKKALLELPITYKGKSTTIGALNISEFLDYCITRL